MPSHDQGRDEARPPLLSAPALNLSILFILFILSKTCTGSCLVAVNQTRQVGTKTDALQAEVGAHDVVGPLPQRAHANRRVRDTAYG